MGYIAIYDLSITGDCSNTGSGGFSFSITGDSGPTWLVYDITLGGTLPTSAATDYYEVTGLYSNTYFIDVQDSVDNLPIVINISSGTTVSVLSSDTTCGLDNGSITAATQYVYGQSFYYLYDGSNNLISTGTTNDLYFEFSNLSADTYYVIADDGGGCTGSTSSVLIQPSVPFDFGYYVVSDSSCFDEGNGKIFITGLTSISDYVITWLSDVNGQTGSTIIGLTSGVYQVEIQDPNLCITSKSINVPIVDVIGLGAFFVTPSSECFIDDAIVNVVITGGTAPFYYSGSSGQVGISFATSFTFTGVSAGDFAVNVTDAGLCSFYAQTSVLNPNTFYQVDINTTNSNCSSNNGTIQIIVDQGNPPLSTFNYSVSGDSGYYQSISFGNPIQTFNGLGSGNYIITVSDDNGCTFTGTTSITNVSSFSVTANTTGTTCGFNNGILEILVSTGGTYPYSFTLVGPQGDSQIRNNNLGVFENLPPGNYDLIVSDSSSPTCNEESFVFISSSDRVSFDFYVNQPVFGGDGRISVYITRGTPPFTYNWSGDVGSQTGLVITGASSGEYSLEITDSNGSGLKKDVTLFGTKSVSNYRTFTICEQTFESVNTVTKRGMRQMFWEGFADLTSGDTNCILTSADFIIVASVDAETKEEIFYNSSGFTDYPADSIWANTIIDVLSTFPGISNVVVDIETNKVTITNDCGEMQKNCENETVNILNNTPIIVYLKINYDIACVSCI
jgi:hypothetical protein